MILFLTDSNRRYHLLDVHAQHSRGKNDDLCSGYHFPAAWNILMVSWNII